MKIRRCFWLLHHVADKKVEQKATDFPAEMTHEQCRADIFTRYNSNSDLVVDGSYADFAEVISSTVCEKNSTQADPFTTPKHLGTGRLIPPAEWAAMEQRVDGKPRKKSNKIL